MSWTDAGLVASRNSACPNQREIAKKLGSAIKAISARNCISTNYRNRHSGECQYVAETLNKKILLGV
jgi:hypothetical protein